MGKTILHWVLKLVAATIMLQTLYFKFSADPASVYIFTTIGMEPWGRIGIGVGELIASILILTYRFEWAGAFMAVGLMAGAIFFHIAFLGISVHDDGGKLFMMAVTVLVTSGILLLKNKEKIITEVLKGKI